MRYLEAQMRYLDALESMSLCRDKIQETVDGCICTFYLTEAVEELLRYRGDVDNVLENYSKLSCEFPEEFLEFIRILNRPETQILAETDPENF
jgi:hypothetical protein